MDLFFTAKKCAELVPKAQTSNGGMGGNTESITYGKYASPLHVRSLCCFVLMMLRFDL